MKLHIGGRQRKEGWHVLNIQPGEAVDFIGDISDLSQFADESFDMVYASHVLEHIPQTAVVPTLQGICRVLKPGGQFLVSVPDWDTLCHMFISPIFTQDVKWHVMRMMMGGQTDAHDFHYVGLNEEFLYGFLNLAGFSEAERVESLGQFQDTSEFKPYGYLISLNVIATK